MAKTYTESVKLPKLVSVPHPLKNQLSKSALNIEGRNSVNSSSNDFVYKRSATRKELIKNIIG
jgi:hypothetical protein